jgi:hypothetical protein
MANSQMITPDGGEHVNVVAAAQVRAEQIHAIWAINDRPVALGEAHRLLDAAALADVLVTCLVRRCREFGRRLPQRNSSGEYTFPSFTDLLPVLREWSWGWICDGRLVLSGVDANDILKGKRLVIPVDRLKLFEPNFERSLLVADGRVVICDVLVEAPSISGQEAQKRNVSEHELEACVSEIVATWHQDQESPGAHWLREIVIRRIGPVSLERVKEARRKIAPHWQRKRGAPCGKRRVRRR